MYSYDNIADWYDIWFEGYYKSEEPANAISALIEKYRPSAVRKEMKILDCACGTGNPYIAMRRKGFDLVACDGSVEMIKRAIGNSEREGVDSSGIIKHPVRWDKLLTEFGARTFDIVISTGNSLFHEPPTNDGVIAALSNMFQILSDDGICIIDTKKYNEMREEINWDGDNGIWIKRTRRYYGIRTIPSSSDFVELTSELEYEYDNYGKATRGVIGITMSMKDSAGVKKVERCDVPFFPLPAGELSGWMNMVGFGFVEKIDGYEDDGLGGYDVYDLLVGVKKISRRW